MALTISKMPDKTWIGGAFLKGGNGYGIVLRSLEHYKKRVQTISSSPEIKESGAMFGQILQQEGMKTKPKIQASIEAVKSWLANKKESGEIIGEVPMIVKALDCYKTDIKKALESGSQYYIELVGNMEKGKKDLNLIEEAKEKINQFE
ncbi:MAG: hypothetical protein GWN01_16720 [Nitrosopumilaceae archaeon]|nr:hypothetical protein [Nitrosopumilaceae archaeon]NIU02477.1 hypothetical protein [Nitrosopumilaceae archaeon]NIU88938.1 hypothetical protein [Nitrosopumilaceae archaeon]NIV67049.1 hypothetical protein [Nitrosopumilaceae archaeon]NIX63078.1 hypothetical protein [Nitrosopumilaceae archaeon]